MVSSEVKESFARTHGRPRRDHSTRRNPSDFELTAGTQARRLGRVGGESFSVKLFLLGFIQQLADHFTLAGIDSPHIATSTVLENAMAAAAVIPIDDPTLLVKSRKTRISMISY